MNAKSAKSSPINSPTRCNHRFANGKRCRLFSQGENLRFCNLHANLNETQHEPADLAATLTDGLADFTSPAPINDFLSRLLLLLAQDRICARRAAVLAYITNQLLRTVSAMEQEAENDRPKKAPMKVIWDIPRPPREQTIPTP